jgi:hypothetical protein
MFRLIAIDFSQKSPHFSLLSSTSPCELSEREVASPSNLKEVGALDNYSLVFVIFINFFGQLKYWVGQVLFLVSCPKGQVEKYVNVEAWTGLWFSPGTLISSTNKTDCHDITEILLKVALNTINQPDNKEQFVQLDIHFVLENYWHWKHSELIRIVKERWVIYLFNQNSVLYFGKRQFCFALFGLSYNGTEPFII